MDAAALVAAGWWGSIAVIAIGTLLHFVYDWSGHRRWVAIFAAVNESTWEHAKIALWPMVLHLAVLAALGGGQHASFVPAAALALYAIPISMIGIAALYTRLAGRNILGVDITLFCVSILTGQAVFTLAFTQWAADAWAVALSALFLAGLVAALARYTMYPPRDPDFFIDPLTHRYGLQGHPHPVPGAPALAPAHPASATESGERGPRTGGGGQIG